MGLVLRIPGWESPDEKRRFVLFEADEIQHVDIAMNHYQRLSGDSLVNFSSPPIYNAQGYGLISGQIAWLWSLVEGKTPTVQSIVLLNRQLSTVFSLLLIFLVYLLGRGYGRSENAAAYGALLLALCDLNCSYSHYGIPAIGYVMGAYLTIYGGQQWWRSGHWTGLVWMATGAAIAFSFKFDFLPLFAGGVLLIYGIIVKPQRSWTTIALASVLFLFCFSLLTNFSWSPTTMWDSWNTLRSVNEDVVGQDNHWRDNPIVYGAAIVAGIGLPATLLGLLGVRQLSWTKVWKRPDLWVLLLLIALEFLVRWSIDTPFVRRANIFLPALCLAASYAISKFNSWCWIARAVVGYTLLFAVVGQSNHWFETRAAARDWINSNLPAEAVVVATPYVEASGSRKLPRFKAGDEDWDYAVLHGAYYQRYTKSMTTPFGYPECCAGVYHCNGTAVCEALQQLVSGERKDVELVASFKTRRWLPERWLYHHYFGVYESFLGDVLIYKRID